MEHSVALVAIVGMVAGFGLPLLLVAIVLYYKHRKVQMNHETIARLAEKGLPIPPELMEPPRQGNAGLRGGLVLVALGIALSVFFAGWADRPVSSCDQAPFWQTVPNVNPRARRSRIRRAVASTVWRWSFRGADSSPSCMTMMSPADTRAVIRARVLFAVRARSQFQSQSIHPQPTSV